MDISQLIFSKFLVFFILKGPDKIPCRLVMCLYLISNEAT